MFKLTTIAGESEITCAQEVNAILDTIESCACVRPSTYESVFWTKRPWFFAIVVGLFTFVLGGLLVLLLCSSKEEIRYYKPAVYSGATKAGRKVLIETDIKEAIERLESIKLREFLK